MLPRAMGNLANTSLLILGHGSSKHPDSSGSVKMHTEVLRKTGYYAEVSCAFLKEEPFIDVEILDAMKSESICIVPDFLAEGYFTRKVIPEKLNLSEQSKTVRYCPPVGTHPLMTELIQTAVEEVLGEWQPEHTSLLVIGHGSTKNTCSKQTLKSHLAELRSRNLWLQVEDLWLEEAPRVSDWSQVASQRQVIILPFLLNDGQHGGWDIPTDIGIEKNTAVHGVTHELCEKQVRLAPALGTSARFAEVIDAIVRIWNS